LIKHEEGNKIRLFTVLTRSQKYKHKGLTKHAKIRPKKGIKRQVTKGSLKQ